MNQSGNYADCEICSYKIHGDDADYYWKRRCEAAEKYASFRIDMDVSGEYTEKDEFNQYTLWSNWSAIVEERE